jgi:uncharacterized phage-associated protein
MRPAIRSTFDIVAWLGERGGQSGTALKPPFLMQILYLSQALYASEHNQAKLMPATFLATDAGPIEPDLFLALEQGISVDAAVAPADHVEEVLIAVWDAYGQSDQTCHQTRTEFRNSDRRNGSGVSGWPFQL